MASPAVPDHVSSQPEHHRSRKGVLAAVVLVGCLLTATSAWAARVLDDHNERDLLATGTKQAALAISGAVLLIKDPLESVLHVSQATSGSTSAFRTYAERLVGPRATFVSVSLWDTGSGQAHLVDTVGVPPLMAPSSSSARAFIEHAATSPTFLVTSPSGSVDRVAYAVADPVKPRYVVYAERAIPVSRTVPIQAGAPFSDLLFATYLGPSTDAAALATTNVPESQLPLGGDDIAREQIPFGDTTITLVAAPRDRLGGALGRWLPWIFLLGGLAITAAAALVVRRLERARRTAEADRATIADLYRTQDVLHAQQRSIAETLQRALLPARNPDLPGVEVASRYLPGVRGVEIGGDWYSMIALDDDRFGFVVGDVSGRGVSAASIMARMRFTLRAYLAEGHGPAASLTLSARQLDVLEDNHFATVLVGVGRISDHSLELASAGHFSPLVVVDGKADYPLLVAGPPLGVHKSQPYESTLVRMPAGSTMVAFTDGLIERRDEDIDVGLERLAELARSHVGPVTSLLDVVVDELGTESEDDIALLAFRW
jgi:serine phosphatase RsbU (regulator of sigma subunit)